MANRRLGDQEDDPGHREAAEDAHPAPVRPKEAPRLDPEADPLPLAEAAQARRAEHLFEIPPEELVVSGGPGTGLVIFAGEPGEVAARQDQAFLVGLGGAAVATISALALVMMIRGAL